MWILHLFEFLQISFFLHFQRLGSPSASDMEQASETLPSLHALSITPQPVSAAPDETLPSTTPPRPETARLRTPTPRSKPITSSEALRYEGPISYRAYQGEQDLDVIVRLVDDELSEPYNLYTYRYFLDDWYVKPSYVAHICLPAQSEAPSKSAHGCNGSLATQAASLLLRAFRPVLSLCGLASRGLKRLSTL